MTPYMESKTVIVTRGAGGLGKAISKAFLEAGANVVIYDISETLLASAVAELSPLGPLHAAKVDVTDQSQVTAALDVVVAKHGQFDILITTVLKFFVKVQEAL